MLSVYVELTFFTCKGYCVPGGGGGRRGRVGVV